MSKPIITISNQDCDTIYDLLEKEPYNANHSLLIEELGRANIVNTNEVPNNVVKMNSTVEFTVLENKDVFSLKLVYPKDMKGDGTISILSPIGSALIGLSVGQEIEWPLNNNKKTVVHINSIT
ncbi:nucleoside diphosphate kinase regulator [Thalassotalea agariperforans]